MSRKHMATRTEIARIAESFRDELARLHRQMDWPKWGVSFLSLEVQFSEEAPKWYIRCNPNKGTTVEGSDLGVVMAEVYRRLGYADREQGRIETSMAALPAPDSGDDDIPHIPF